MPAETPANHLWKRFRLWFGAGLAVTPLLAVVALITTQGATAANAHANHGGDITADPKDWTSGGDHQASSGEC